jgi:ubiquinone/menaquinone biosynthesis C-methylase UbiE
MSDTPPSPEDRKAGVAGLFATVAPTYDSVVPFFATLGRALVGAAGLHPGDRVLDIASGRGACLLAALEAVRPGGSVLGIDLAPGMIETLAARLADEPDAEARVGDAEAPEVDDASFDAVTCGFGIFFLPAPDAALAAWRRALRPGGTVALSTFVGVGGWPWIKQVAEALSPETAGRPAWSHPMSNSAGVREGLAAAGFTGMRTVDITRRIVFPDLDAAVAWYWTHGFRQFMEALDADGLAEFRRLAGEHLDADHRTPEGGYELVQGAEATLATAP